MDISLRSNRSTKQKFKITKMRASSSWTSSTCSLSTACQHLGIWWINQWTSTTCKRAWRPARADSASQRLLKWPNKTTSLWALSKRFSKWVWPRRKTLATKPRAKVWCTLLKTQQTRACSITTRTWTILSTADTTTAILGHRACPRASPSSQLAKLIWQSSMLRSSSQRRAWQSLLSSRCQWELNLLQGPKIEMCVEIPTGFVLKLQRWLGLLNK